MSKTHRVRLATESKEAPTKLVVTNAKIGKVAVGSDVHEGRWFMTIGTEGSHGQDALIDIYNVGMPAPQWINEFIRVCGATDLLGCQGCYVRVVRPDVGGLGRPIIALVHITDDSQRVSTGIYQDAEGLLSDSNHDLITPHLLDDVVVQGDVIVGKKKPIFKEQQALKIRRRRKKKVRA